MTEMDVFKNNDEAASCYTFYLNFNNTKIVFNDFDISAKAVLLKCKNYALFSPRTLFRKITITGNHVNSSVSEIKMFALSDFYKGLELDEVNITVSIFG